MSVLRPILLLIFGTTAGCAYTGGDQDFGGSSGWTINTENERLEETMIADTNRLAMRGLEVYRQQYCGTCHRFKRAQTSGIFGPAHDNFAIVAEQRIREDAYTGNATTAAEYVRESIVDPDVYIVPGYASGWNRMPPYVDLAPEDLEALVQLLLSGD